jgi:DUF971 family protein
MTAFWILGAAGLAILVELVCLAKVGNYAYKRGYEDGKERGRSEEYIWWLEQGAAVQKAREKMWMEES